MSKHILVVGCGSIGERHLRCLLKTSRATPAVCETNAGLLEKIQKEYQAPGFSDLQEALASMPFAGAVICTPAQTHIPLALTALRAGAGLLIEKPVSVSLDGVDELRSEAARSKSFVAVAYVYHFV